MQMLKSTLQNPNFVLLFLFFWCGGASYAMRGRMHISNIWELDTFSALEGFEATHYMLLLCKQNINTIQSIIRSTRPMIGNCLIIFLEGRGETESPATTQTVCWRICHSNFVEFGTWKLFAFKFQILEAESLGLGDWEIECGEITHCIIFKKKKKNSI